MTRGKPSWLGFKPAPRMHSSRHPLLRIVARSLALQPGIGFRIVSKLFLALGSRFSVASHAQCGQLVKIVFVSLSLSLFLFRFACASRGGIGGVVERKAEIDFHGRVARSLPALLIGNCVPAIDKTAECESWEYVERSFHGFVCVFTGEIREKGESLKREGKVLLIFEEKYIYRYEMKTLIYLWDGGSGNVLADNLNNLIIIRIRISRAKRIALL